MFTTIFLAVSALLGWALLYLSIRARDEERDEHLEFLEEVKSVVDDQRGLIESMQETIEEQHELFSDALRFSTFLKKFKEDPYFAGSEYNDYIYSQFNLCSDGVKGVEISDAALVAWAEVEKEM